MSDPSLVPFFQPQGVLIIGVSRDPTKLGYALARNLVQSGYGGAIHFLNPKGESLFGRPIHTRVADVPDPVDLAVVLVPPPAVPDTLHALGQRGIQAAILATGGFRETGPEGAALEQRCVEIARSYGIRLVGPNCVGLINTHLPLDTTFLQPPPPPTGEIAFLSHSGAICAAVIDWVRGQGIGLSHLDSLGNQADLSESDFLQPVAEDPHTRVITLYLEGVQNGAQFVEKARQAARLKPLVALKVGRFEAGRRAAASHTGALAGAEAAFDAAFARAGVLRANTTEEMFQWARALAWCPLPQGRSVAVLTNAGGPGVTAADALEQAGLTLAQLAPHTESALTALLPAAASTHNPVDMLASATPEQYAGCLRLLLDDPGVDMVLFITPPPPPATTGGVVKAVIPIVQTCDKPVVAALMGDRQIQEGVELARAARIPEYRFPEAAASALGALWQRVLLLQRLEEPTLTPAALRPEALQEMVQGTPAGEFFPAETAAGLMEAAGLPTLRMPLAHSPAEAAQLAAELGFPVVLKLASPDISHKSDVGGVVLNLNTPEEVKAAYELVFQRARAARPEAHLEGAHLQRMVGAGQEVILGVVRDPQFGPLVMFGSGGVEVEGLKDVAFALAPLTREDAERMIERTWAGRKLAGFRSLPPADREAVIQALLRLAHLAAACPQIAEVEINPLRVLAPGQGAVAVDIRARKA